MKKEEAVVNTGSVDAFVKQTISGVLDVTVEVPATTAPTDSTKDKYVKLTQKEFGALEAGSTLAWVPTGSAHKPGVTIGMGIDGKINDDANTTENEDNHAFVPDVTGLYVFRRAVQKTDGTFDDKSFLPERLHFQQENLPDFVLEFIKLSKFQYNINETVLTM